MTLDPEKKKKMNKTQNRPSMNLKISEVKRSIHNQIARWLGELLEIESDTGEKVKRNHMT